MQSHPCERVDEGSELLVYWLLIIRETPWLASHEDVNLYASNTAYIFLLDSEMNLEVK